MWRKGTALAALVLVLLPAAAGAADPGETATPTVTSGGNEYPYIRYTPTTYSSSRAAPLIVMVHGCQTTAAQEVKVTQFNQLAEREGFVVIYPEVNATEKQQQGPTANCWLFADASTYFRDNGDTAAVAAMTRAVMKARNIDPERVYMVGVSAGGLITAAAAAAYSDLYAAVGLVETAGYADGTCFTSGTGTPSEANAQLAFTAMGDNKRVVPRFVITSDGDLAFPASCGIKAMDQGLRTNNLVVSGSQTAPVSLQPTSQGEQQKPGGYGYNVAQFRDPQGCLAGERWIIHGMPHAWPGGGALGGYSDLKAPDGAEGAWAFLRRYTRSETSPPCTEASGSGTGPGATGRACPARWVAVRLPRGAKRVRASVGGKRVKVRIRRHRLRVRVSEGTVVVRGRTRSGRRFTRRRSVRCG